MSECIDIRLNTKLASNVLDILKQTLLDPYDAFYIDSMSRYGIENIITDDADFISTDISVYTTNNKVN